VAAWSIAVLCVEKMATAAPGYVYQTSLYQLDYLSDDFSIYISNTFKKIISIKHIAIKSTCINPVSLIFSTDFVFQTISVTFFAIWLTKPFSVRPIPINLCPSSLNISHQPRCILLFSVKFISVKFIYPTCFSMHISLQLSKIKEKHRTKPLITETAFLKGA